MSKKNKNTLSPKTRKVLDLAVDNIVWIIGCTLYAVAINFFNVPNRISQGGFSGLAIVINYLTDLPVGAINLALNVPILLIALKFIGKKFVLKTLWVTVLLSVIIDLVALIPYEYTSDTLLASIFSGALLGAGVALVAARGSTTGGTDVLSKLLRLVFPHMSYGKLVMFSDMVVIAISAIVFRSIESALYAAVVIFVSSKVIDYILYGMAKSKMLMVVTDRADEISQELVNNSPRGVSIIPAKGAFTGQEKNMLICVLRSNEVAPAIKLIKSIDPNTFTIITEANEIIGKGFKPTINE
ncbi:MAG: YitT family protein [Clostridia bacterium]|nr:YitT family protein [Clostridia bacterium]